MMDAQYFPPHHYTVDWLSSNVGYRWRCRAENQPLTIQFRPAFRGSNKAKRFDDSQSTV
jgi:hypothetical protein